MPIKYNQIILIEQTAITTSKAPEPERFRYLNIINRGESCWGTHCSLDIPFCVKCLLCLIFPVSCESSVVQTWMIRHCGMLTALALWRPPANSLPCTNSNKKNSSRYQYQFWEEPQRQWLTKRRAACSFWVHAFLTEPLLTPVDPVPPSTSSVSPGTSLTGWASMCATLAYDILRDLAATSVSIACSTNLQTLPVVQPGHNLRFGSVSMDHLAKQKIILI